MIKNQDELDEYMRMLLSDLDSLFKLVFTLRKPVAEGDIRLASIILRKWLIEGYLGKLCNATRMKATFYALDNRKVMDALPAVPQINYFLTAGVKMDGRPVAAIYNANVPPTDKPLVPVDSLEYREFTSHQFIKQKRLYFEGAYFSLEEIIKFTANKLGGAHLDFERPGAYESLNNAAHYMMYGGPARPIHVPAPIHLYMVLEPKSTEILSGLHLEIIAAASSFIQFKLGGHPFKVLNQRRSIKSRVRDWMRPGGSRIIGYGEDDKYK